MRDIVLVSNRGPVSFSRTEGGYELKRGAGGMAGALDPVARELGDQATWIAAATSDDDREAARAGEVERLRDELGYAVRLLDIEPETYDRYYNVVSNRMLWFANHCLWDELGLEGFGGDDLRAFEDAYERVNRLFADQVTGCAGSDALVLFQDYHLARAPALLRASGGDHIVSHFTHSAFCDMNRGLGRLPGDMPRLIVEGMLGADLVGFHVSKWAEGFFDCCEAIGATVDRNLGTVTHDGHRSWVRTYPITIDPDGLRERAAEEPAQMWARRFRDYGVKLLMRADRAEPIKNIVRGFQAWGLLLDRRPDLRESARFVACLYPTREDMDEYKHYTERIESIVEDINSGYPGSIDFYLHNEYDRTLGALLSYDALLVNSIMDGMNLVAKEGPTVNQNNGVLILSKETGSHEELGDLAVVIENPYDLDATADAMEAALDMSSDERVWRAEGLRKTIESHVLTDWIDIQLNDLSRIADDREPETPTP